MAKGKKISTKEFDRIADEGKQDLTEYLDLDSGIKRVSVDFPLWMIGALDAEATRLGIPRQAVIKTMIDEGLKARGASPSPGGRTVGTKCPA